MIKHNRIPVESPLKKYSNLYSSLTHMMALLKPRILITPTPIAEPMMIEPIFSLRVSLFLVESILFRPLVKLSVRGDYGIVFIVLYS